MLRSRQRPPDISQFPASFTRKVEQVRKLLPANLPTSDGVRCLLQTAVVLHKHRTLLVHGIFQGTHLDGALGFSLADHRKGVSGGHIQYLQPAQLEDICAQIEAVADGLLDRFHDLRALPPDKF